jgi:hypothetical protein
MAMDWRRLVRVKKQKIERLNINATIYAIITSDSAKSTSSLSCLLSSPIDCCAASCLPPPQLLVMLLPPIRRRLPVHLSLHHHLLSCPSSSLVRLHLVCPSWLSCHLLSCHHLPSTCPSASYCTTASHCAPLMPFVRLVVTSPISILFISATRRDVVVSSLAVLRTSSSTTHREFA